MFLPTYLSTQLYIYLPTYLATHETLVRLHLQFRSIPLYTMLSPSRLRTMTFYTTPSPSIDTYARLVLVCVSDFVCVRTYLSS